MRPYVPGLGELLFGLSLKKKNTLYRNLGVSLGSGLPLTRALDLASTELSVSVKRDMQEAVAEGLTL
ncbi:hypothetical protein IJT17_08930 [bacterium]|nr:hypothetical protein [bacterium]